MIYKHQHIWLVDFTLAILKIYDLSQFLSLYVTFSLASLGVKVSQPNDNQANNNTPANTPANAPANAPASTPAVVNNTQTGRKSSDVSQCDSRKSSLQNPRKLSTNQDSRRNSYRDFLNANNNQDNRKISSNDVIVSVDNKTKVQEVAKTNGIESRRRSGVVNDDKNKMKTSHA